MSAELSQGTHRTSPLAAADIDAAARRISSVVTRTPLQYSDRLSALTGAQVYLKREDLQAVRSYKLRGAYNLLMQLSDEEKAAGVVCSSAGNHAQGFALACRSMGIHGRVYVPAKTPKQKRDRIRYHGGEFIELIVGGKTYDLAAQAALDDVARTGATLVPPYDDVRTMAGQGTIAVEILDQLVRSSGLKNRTGLRILDIGAGKGYLTFALHDHLRRLGRGPSSCCSSSRRSSTGWSFPALTACLVIVRVPFLSACAATYIAGRARTQYGGRAGDRTQFF